MAHLTLTFDHRVCDGGTAVGFLRHVIEGITDITDIAESAEIAAP